MHSRGRDLGYHFGKNLKFHHFSFHSNYLWEVPVKWSSFLSYTVMVREPTTFQRRGLGIGVFIYVNNILLF